ncbi:MAG: Tat pathway signal protein [Clostridia bacterium]|nr:Tat pathway signal protein [Clostridia bacterium]
MEKKYFLRYMIILSEHMWGDEATQPAGWYLPAPYKETNDTDIEVWDETVKYLADHKFNLLLIDVGDGVKYDTHPEISAPDAWSKEFLKKKLDEIRALGIMPVPKLNFSAGHDTWLKKYRRMISTPEYYRVCSDLIAEVCELFGYPELFHLGFDEEDAATQAPFEMVIVRGEELWFHDLNLLAAECAKHGARPWIWSDYIWEHKDVFLKKMSKDILQSNWYYNPFKDNLPSSPYRFREWIDAYELLDKHGFDQIPTCSCWVNNTNVRQTVAYCKDKLSSEHLAGILVAPWLRTNRENSHDMLRNAERLYFARKDIYPETL